MSTGWQHIGDTNYFSSYFSSFALILFADSNPATNFSISCADTLGAFSASSDVISNPVTSLFSSLCNSALAGSRAALYSKPRRRATHVTNLLIRSARMQSMSRNIGVFDWILCSGASAFPGVHSSRFSSATTAKFVVTQRSNSEANGINGFYFFVRGTHNLRGAISGILVRRD